MKGISIAVLMVFLVVSFAGCGDIGTPTNSAPIADAGPDQNVTTGTVVTLDGSGSTDANGDALTYSWTITSEPAGSTATLSNATVAKPTFTADLDDSYVISLVVNDGTVNSTADTVTITASTQAAGATVSLPKTGQTTIYNAGDDGALQNGVAWPNPRFTVGTGAEAECVTDNLTGLTWVKSPDSTTRTWQGALDYANGLTLCGYTDWRLPNRKELCSLVDYSKFDPALPIGHPFLNVQSFGYWSSSTGASRTDSAWGVDMWSGFVGYDYKTSNYYVLPVRAGQ